jgi:hypothetical protein
MSKKLIERKKFRLTVKLDYGWDADLIRWLETLPEGYRSEAVRQGLRQFLKSREEPDLRKVISDELAKALEGRQIAGAPAEKPQAAQDDAEARYGSKLDQMLGGLRKSSGNTNG